MIQEPAQSKILSEVINGRFSFTDGADSISPIDWKLPCRSTAIFTRHSGKSTRRR